MTEKLCSKCGPKPIEAFNRGNGSHGRASYCRDCMHAYQRLQREAHGAIERNEYAMGRRFRPEELVPCPKCSLRGPHECIGSVSTGIGNWSWV